MRHFPRGRHGCEPSLHLSFRHGEVDGADISRRAARDTADGDIRIDQIQLGLPIHAAQIRDELVACKGGIAGHGLAGSQTPLARYLLAIRYPALCDRLVRS